MKTMTMLMMAGALLLESPVAAVGEENASMPDVAVGPDTSYFVGTQECTWGDTSTEYIDGVEHYKEHYSCVTETTDPRFTGTEELDIVTYGGYGIASPWTAEGVVSGAEGSWHGSGQGMVDYQGAPPLGTPGHPFNYGEMTYIGDDAYEGLVVHYYFAGSEIDALALSGWVTPTE